MYVKSTRMSAKREVQKERSAKRDDQVARPRRAQICELRAKRAMRMCPRSGQIFFFPFMSCIKEMTEFSVPETSSLKIQSLLEPISNLNPKRIL